MAQAELTVAFPFAFYDDVCARLIFIADNWLTWVAGFAQKWFTRPKTVTHPDTNRARRNYSLIETNAVLLKGPFMATQLNSTQLDVELSWVVSL